MSDVVDLLQNCAHALVFRYLIRRWLLVRIARTDLIIAALRRLWPIYSPIGIDEAATAVAEANADAVAEVHRVNPSEHKALHLCLVSHDAVTA